ncbi:MAG TPA: hypothetical protein VGM17_05475 [Rhizomicrobium sp.]|jgi:hypothetical protein
MRPDISPKLARASRIMAWLALAGAVVYVALDIGTFLIPDALNAFGAFQAHHLGMQILSTIPLALRADALALDLVPTALFAWMLLELRLLFLAYANGAVFTAESLARLSRISALMFVQVAAAFVMEAPISFVLSLAHPPGHRAVSLTLSSYDVSFLFTAGVLLVIARVMAEARSVAVENAEFV